MGVRETLLLKHGFSRDHAGLKGNLRSRFLTISTSPTLQIPAPTCGQSDDLGDTLTSDAHARRLHTRPTHSKPLTGGLDEHDGRILGSADLDCRLLSPLVNYIGETLLVFTTEPPPLQ